MRDRIPNALSASRIALAFAVVTIYPDLTPPRFVVTLCIAAVAMISDFLDGALARRWGVCSDAGYVLDAMGDRAVHLAFLLVVQARYDIHPVLVWLLVFRDIAIYGVRVLSKQWQKRSRDWRWLSVLHATALRFWLALFVLRDGVRLIRGRDALGTPLFDIIQLALVLATIGLSYFGLYRSLEWLVDREHEAL